MKAKPWKPAGRGRWLKGNEKLEKGDMLVYKKERESWHTVEDGLIGDKRSELSGGSKKNRVWRPEKPKKANKT